MTIDLFPTLARLIGAALPGHTIDGLDVWPLLAGEPGGEEPPRGLSLLLREQPAPGGRQRRRPLEARSSPHLSHPRRPPRRARREPVEIRASDVNAPELYDLKDDLGETTDVASPHPDVVASLLDAPRRPATNWATASPNERAATSGPSGKGRPGGELNLGWV